MRRLFHENVAQFVRGFMYICYDGKTVGEILGYRYFSSSFNVRSVIILCTHTYTYICETATIYMTLYTLLQYMKKDNHFEKLHVFSRLFLCKYCV